MSESAKADKAAARIYVSEYETVVTEGRYDPRQVFNVDEIRFNCKRMPKKRFITTADMNAKIQRFGVLIGGNAYGD